MGLSILSRGSMDEKLRWTFSLYDINGDGCITREEMTDIVTAVYELMGKFADPNLSHNHEGVRHKVDRMFQVMQSYTICVLDYICRLILSLYTRYMSREIDLQYLRDYIHWRFDRFFRMIYMRLD